MKKNNKGKGRQHINVLGKSTMDTISLGDALHYRFVTLCGDYLRTMHEPLVPPSELDADMLLWRQMMVRHNNLDYRNTADELKAVQRIAQWCVDIKCELTGTTRKIVEWAS